MVTVKTFSFSVLLQNGVIYEQHSYSHQIVYLSVYLPSVCLQCLVGKYNATCTERTSHEVQMQAHT